MRLTAIWPLLLAALWALGCAHAPPTSNASYGDDQPPSEEATSLASPSCLDYVEWEGPEDIATSLLRACHQFSQAHGVSQSQIRDALRGTRITVLNHRLATPCSQGAPGCVFVFHGHADVYVEQRRWNSLLPNTLFRLLLIRLEPERPIDDHNARLFDLGLCQTGFTCGRLFR